MQGSRCFHQILQERPEYLEAALILAVKNETLQWQRNIFSSPLDNPRNILPPRE
jgi:hypothetical protein